MTSRYDDVVPDLRASYDGGAAERDNLPKQQFKLDERALFLDRLRALFMPLDRPPSPGFLRTLREALGLTQAEFGARAERPSAAITARARMVLCDMDVS